MPEHQDDPGRRGAIREELLTSWAATRIVMDGPPAVPLTGPDAVESWPFEEHIVVLTAANPGSERLEPEVNATRNVELAAALRDLRYRVLGVTAGLDDWEEPSLGIVGLDREVTRGLAVAFEQLGWFELDADQVKMFATHDGTLLHAGPRRHE